MNTEIEKLKIELQRMQEDYFQAEQGAGILRRGLEQMRIECERLSVENKRLTKMHYQIVDFMKDEGYESPNLPA
jgi:hypothetical protein